MTRVGGSVVPAALVVVAVAGCEGPQRVLDARGPGAQQIATLWWIMLALAVFAAAAMSALLLFAIFRARRRAAGRAQPEVDGRTLVWAGGVLVPAAMLFTSLIYSYRLSGDVYPPRAAGGEPLTVELIGHRFWWEVRYPAYGVTTANEFRIPVGVPVRFRVTSNDVIHSFWIPQLQGKIDMIPGRTHEWWVRADSAGVFRGQCAEYCGVGHALMALWVTATPEDAFATWITSRAEPSGAEQDEAAQRGLEVFAAARCGHCHAAPGAPVTPELEGVAPTLADLAERRTIAAGTLRNTRENLMAWITDPEAVKPGTRMPPTRLSTEDLEALVSYLGTPP
jgi:cytochrome c oxidase subunit II